ncbi:SLOG family protein [Hymenobacter caeli]|uniref:Rossmann fold nucleotide-binding protein DprA/Smf involved in DNA uptake n=1 Tax=Hymenobacter caeli TaxID=2735894 RepID=A0ABX2FQB7_9BACT|nr:SLOG family protein [Hymenobacter caeli]NRT19365.1 putative Rossmann fold nucleotide-binding protein DprA/Smf involved in DNA uptake [Hymenobacter caeli]
MIKKAAGASGLVVAVIGSRGLVACATLPARLAELAPAELVSGGAAGADTMGAEWARANGVPLRVLRPDYCAHGPAAPHVRNAEIVAAADVVLVVWDGKSRGTLSAARAAARLGRRCEWLAAPAPGAAPVPGGLGL